MASLMVATLDSSSVACLDSLSVAKKAATKVEPLVGSLVVSTGFDWVVLSVSARAVLSVAPSVALLVVWKVVSMAALMAGLLDTAPVVEKAALKVF